MKFKDRDYITEAKAHSLPRVIADTHPLSTSSSSSSTSCSSRSVQVDVYEIKNDIVDPLRALSCDAAVHHEDISDVQSTSTSSLSSDAAAQYLAKEWTTFKRLLVQRFPVAKMVSVSTTTAVVVRSDKAQEKPSSVPVDELDDPDLEGSGDQYASLMSQQEYITRLSELKNEILSSWHTGDRVTSLKLSIKVAKLLMDTTPLQFYPTSFSLATDILDMLGQMVWERIMKKAEFSEDGTRLCSLPEDFQTRDICLEAKETCYNWFCKIGSIRELLPRIYLGLAILPCWRFLVDQRVDILHRLVMMMRGLADPLASAYCHLYMVRCAQKWPMDDNGYLITCINDINAMMVPIISAKANGKGSSSKLISLIEPTIEYIVKWIFRDPQHASHVLVELGLGKNQSQLSRRSVYNSLILHHLLKELSAEVVSSNAVRILRLIECSNDSSFEQHVNFRLLGFRLLEKNCSVDVLHEVMDIIIQVVSKYPNLDEYLKVVDAYIDITLQNQMKNDMQLILEGIAKRACNKWMVESELENMQPILLKLLTHLNCVEDALELSHFVDILDVMRGKSTNAINMFILDMATRNGYIRNHTTVQFLFEVAQGLCDSVDSNMIDDESQQSKHLLSRFIQMVDYGMEMELNLAFLVDCRGAFGGADQVKETLVHSGNKLAIKALKDAKMQVSFVKSCLAFCEVTIPSISACIKQLNLYLETAEVALMGGLLCHSDKLIDSALSCLQSYDLADDSKRLIDADDIISAIQKLCSLLVMVPGNPDYGAVCIPKRLLSLVNSSSWMTPRVRAKTLCGLALTSAALSQHRLPYHAQGSEVFSNDMLYFGDPSYHHELVSLSRCTLQNMVHVIQKESYKVGRGSLALEACNCITLCLEMNDEVLPICMELMDIAKSCLKADHKYLQSTFEFLDKQLQASGGAAPLLARS